MRPLYMQCRLPRSSAVAVPPEPASRSKPKLLAVRRSLAGLPVHRAPGAPPRLSGCGRDACLSTSRCGAGGLLVVPVLQPESDNIPFGLALSWQRQSAACHPPSSNHAVMEEDLYELQYVLEGKGEVRVCQEVSAPELEAHSHQLAQWPLLTAPCLVDAVIRKLWGVAKHRKWGQHPCPNGEGMVSAWD